jgi:RHS repeat-associated protein
MISKLGLLYDPASQVTNILHQLTATSIQINQAAYVYNPVGNRTSLTDRRGAQTFGYDNLDRLTSASHPLLATPQSFAYDPVGNRTTAGNVHNAGNQLTADATHSYQYDDNGNLTRKTLLATGNFTQFTYDAESRLVKVEDFAAGNPTAAFTSTYRYDGLGRRIEKVANGQTRRYVYDNEDILLEYDENNALLARYTHGPGFDEPIAMTRGGSTFFYHQDGLASVTELTDSTGSTARSYAYDVWGNLLDQTGTIENPYTYTGRELDTESGLYYYRARSYDPTLGRFLLKDPAGLGKGTSQYLYVDGNPATLIDPDGLQAIPYPTPGPPIPFPLPPIAVPGSPENQQAAQATAQALQQMQNAIQTQINKLRKGRWTCTAQCNVQSIGKGCCPDRVSGTASGPSEEIACREAKRAAVRSTPEGCYARHCKCDCQKN